MTGPHLCDLAPKWSWALRHVDPAQPYRLVRSDGHPRPGDIVAAEVTAVRSHTRMTLCDQSRTRLFPGDRLVGVFGNRYATDAFEARACGVDQLHLLTGAGMVGTVVSRHRERKAPTSLRFLGFVTDAGGQRVNTKELLFHPRTAVDRPRLVVLVVGSQMNSGKTTVAARLSWALQRAGARVAACKITGSVSRRDRYELASPVPSDLRDFSDYGFPSTYLCPQAELLALFDTMVADALRSDPDVVVMEVADGVLQRETDALLRASAVQRAVAATVVTAPCASSALHTTRRLGAIGIPVAAVSGLITNAPLAVREFNDHSRVPVWSATDAEGGLAERVLSWVQQSVRHPTDVCA